MPIRSALRALNDPTSITHGVVSSCVVGVLTLIDPRRLTVGQRLVYRLANAGLAAWTVGVGFRSSDPSGAVPPVGRAALVAGAAGAALGFADAGEAVDARVQDAIARTGARHPRRWLAAGGTVLAFGSWWASRTLDAPGNEDTPEVHEAAVDLPEDVRALAAHLLAATDLFGAPELRAQLAHAQRLVFDDSDGGFWPVAQLQVDVDLPRAVPADATFPVVGRFRAMGDVTFDVRLVVTDGVLASLFVDEGGDWTPEQRDAWYESGGDLGALGGWPALGDLEMLIESPEGLRPIGVWTAGSEPDAGRDNVLS